MTRYRRGHAASGICVTGGSSALVSLVNAEVSQIATSPGDCVYVPPCVPHRAKYPPADQ